jgi:NADPH:quinone reductase-like Zn-dependent oxidoreductase
MVTGAFITSHGHPPELRPYDLPAPGAGQSLIRVTAAPITPLDVLCAGGTSYFGPPVLPYVPGVQGVGVVDQGDRAGARVWFNTDAGMRPGDGSLAEAAVVHDLESVDVPDGVSDVDAAALGLSAVAAWMALTFRGRLEAGERVLVLGAGGAVGQVAVQAATALGAGAVVAASRRPRGRDRALEQGATAAVDLSDADVDEVTARLRAAADGGVDVIVDPVGGATATAALRILAEHGRLVHLGSSGGAESTFSSATLRSGSHSILGYTNNSLTRPQRAAALAEIFALAADGRCQVEHRAYPLPEVAAAWQEASGTPDARVVVTPAIDQVR